MSNVVIFFELESQVCIWPGCSFLTLFSEVASALTIWTDIFCARCLPAPNQIYFLIWPKGIFSLGTCHCSLLGTFSQGFPASKARVEAQGTLKSQFSPSSLYRLYSESVMGCLLWLQPGGAGKWFVSAHLDYSVAASSCKSCQPKNSLSVLPSQWGKFCSITMIFLHWFFYSAFKTLSLCWNIS